MGRSTKLTDCGTTAERGYHGLTGGVQVPPPTPPELHTQAHSLGGPLQANLAGVTADAETDWSEDFDPAAAGVIFT